MPLAPPRVVMKLTHPERVVDAASGATKADVARYYEGAADWLLPQLKGRPAALLRAPEGVGGESFFQKHAGRTAWPLQPKGDRNEPTPLPQIDQLIIHNGTAHLDDAPLQLLGDAGFATQQDGHWKAELKGRLLYQCNRCKQQVGLTAGTVFHWTKLPLTTWFLAIYHLSQSKGGISSVELARRLGTRQPTAWLIKHKLMAAMAAREAEKPKLAGRVEVEAVKRLTAA